MKHLFKLIFFVLYYIIYTICNLLNLVFSLLWNFKINDYIKDYMASINCSHNKIKGLFLFFVLFPKAEMKRIKKQVDKFNFGVGRYDGDFDLSRCLSGWEIIVYGIMQI